MEGSFSFMWNLDVTREVWKRNLSTLGLVRRRKDGSELEVEERSIREALNFDKMSLPRT